MDFLKAGIEEWALKFTSPESELLKKLSRETHSRVLMPRMLSGHLQGRFLSLISRLISPNRILEIGTYTGYSAICLAEGLAPGGTLTTIDINDELEEMVNRYLTEAGISDQVNYLTGDATKIIPDLDETFDIVFIDADKQNYPVYFDLVIGKVRKGGLIIADNVLWSGKVLEENPDRDTQALIRYSEKVNSDNRVENLLLPLRDGLLISVRK